MAIAPLVRPAAPGVSARVKLSPSSIFPAKSVAVCVAVTYFAAHRSLYQFVTTATSAGSAKFIFTTGLLALSPVVLLSTFRLNAVTVDVEVAPEPRLAP
jgi:hypothetical protein